MLKAVPNEPFALDEDILHLIFHSGTLDDPQCFPHAVSRVSRSWRELALNTATLWSSLLFSGSAANLAKQEERVRRSGTTLLDIEVINVQRKSLHSFHPDLEAVMAIIRPLSTRWRSFITPASSAIFSWDIALMLKDVRAPNLEVLSIHDYGYGTNLRRRRPIQLLEGPTPRLRKLAAPALAIGAARLHMSSGLRSMDVERYTFHCESSQAASDIRALLSGCPQLESLRLTDTKILSYEGNTAIYSSDHPTIRHDRLLSLGVDDASLMKTLLATVHLPALRTFGTYISPESLQVICRSSPCPRLENIRLRAGRQSADTGVQAPEALLPKMFGILPCLKSLELRDYEFSDHVWLDELGYLCPKLEFLDLQLCNGVSEEALKEMIEARIESRNMQQIISLTAFSCGATETGNKWLGWLLENVDRVEPRSFRKRGFQTVNRAPIAQ